MRPYYGLENHVGTTMTCLLAIILVMFGNQKLVKVIGLKYSMVYAFIFFETKYTIRVQIRKDKLMYKELEHNKSKNIY